MYSQIGSKAVIGLWGGVGAVGAAVAPEVVAAITPSPSEWAKAFSALAVAVATIIRLFKRSKDPQEK